MDLNEFFKKYEFIHAAAIIHDSEGRHTFELQDKFKPKGEFGDKYGWVYIWVGVFQGRPDIPLYVGKAGQTQTLRQRFSQHKQGFYTSQTGIKNSGRILDFFNTNPNHDIWIYARHSESGSAFDVNGISLCEFEEMALIKKLQIENNILWNFSRSLIHK